MDRFDYLIVGAGFAGSVCAERLASAGKRVLLIDQRNHIGGNAYDYYDDAGILVHKYGPHIFHTNSQAVFEYLSQFTEWRPYEHRVLASVNGQLLPVPINRTTLKAFDNDPVAAVEAIYRPYTRKQWGCEPEDLDPSVLARVKVRDSYDDRYFADTFQFMPLQGYTRLFEKMLDHPNIEISLNHLGPTINSNLDGAPLIYTGPIDAFFDYRFGKLPYRSARFERRSGLGSGQPVGVVNFPSANQAFTRVTEFRHLTGQAHEMNSIAVEYPCDDGEPFWPIPKPENHELYKRYKALADQTSGVHFCGRLGTYSYLNMDQCVAQALKLTSTLLQEAPCRVRS